MKDQEQPRPDFPSLRMSAAPTLTTLTQSDHDIIRTFLSSVPAGFPLSPGAALAELTGFAPLSPGLIGLAASSSHGFHPSPSRFDTASPGRFPPYPEPILGYKNRTVHSPLRIHSPPRSTLDSPHRGPSALSSPQRTEQGSMKRFDPLYSYSPLPHRRSPSPNRTYSSPYRVHHFNHVYAPILPSRAFEYNTPAPSPPPPPRDEARLGQAEREATPPLEADLGLEMQQGSNVQDLELRNKLIAEKTRRIATSQCRKKKKKKIGGFCVKPASKRTSKPQLNNVDSSQQDFNKPDGGKPSSNRDKPRITESIKPVCAGPESSKASSRHGSSKHELTKPDPRKSDAAKPEPKSEKVLELTALENNSKEVEARLLKGCGCGQRCYRWLDREKVFKHRVDISKLNKGEHDMYLMGMMMGTLADPNQTSKNKLRKRRRNKYIYQGSEVCQEAYLYLENVSIYQIKLIRKHVSECGVVPRLHKNSGRKPVNCLDQDHSKQAHVFLQEFLASENSGRKKGLCDLTFKNLHQHYREHFSTPGERTMAYSTFRKFVNLRFPLINFRNESQETKKKKGVVAQDAINLPLTAGLRPNLEFWRTTSKIHEKMEDG